jgi:hypothetical protein
MNREGGAEVLLVQQIETIGDERSRRIRVWTQFNKETTRKKHLRRNWPEYGSWEIKSQRWVS